MSPPRTPARRADRGLAAVTLLLLLAVLTGCGVRLETPPPAPLVPDADEQARQRTSADAVALEVLAQGAGAVPAPDPVLDPAGDAVAAARAAVAAEAATHLTLLGGLYDAGPASAAAGPGQAEGSVAPDAPEEDRPETPAASPAPDPLTATPAALVTRLTEAAATARADTATVADGALARLLGSIAVSRHLSAARLAAVAGATAPPVPAAVLPDAVPDGLGDADLGALVAAEDAAGYGYEVVAAKQAGDTRRLAGQRAAEHRARAQTWAELGGVDGTGLDPRRIAYAVPPGLEDPSAAAALAQSLETTLAAHYAALVAEVAPEARPAFVDAAAEATAHAVTWGAPLPALPGLPEHAAG